MTFLFDLLFGKFSFLLRKEELQEVIKVRQDSLREIRDWHFPGSLISLEIEEHPQTEKSPGAPRGKAVKAKPQTPRSHCSGWGSCCCCTLGLAGTARRSQMNKKLWTEGQEQVSSWRILLQVPLHREFPTACQCNSSFLRHSHYREKWEKINCTSTAGHSPRATIGLQSPSKSHLVW